MPTPKSFYGIKGTVTVDGSDYEGARVWMVSQKYGENTDTVKDVTYFYTDGSGKYLIDVANIATSVNNGDVVRVYCNVAGDLTQYADVTLDTSSQAQSTQNFTITTKSGLSDGLKDTPNSDGTEALLRNQLRKGLKDGMT